MTEDWFEAAVELNAGYAVLDADGAPVSSVPQARVALQGGFAKLRLPGAGTVQVVSAPAVRLITQLAGQADPVGP